MATLCAASSPRLIMDEDLQVNASVTIPASELSFKASRAGGAGGQHVNKTSSRVTVECDVEMSLAITKLEKLRIYKHLGGRINSEGVLQLSVDESRSQHANRELARRRLAEIVRGALKVQKKRVKTRPSRASKERRIDAKRKTSCKKKMRCKPRRDD